MSWLGYYRTMNSPVTQRFWYNFKGEPITAEEFEKMFRARGLHVAQTHLRMQGRHLRVSTVLLGVNYNWRPEGRPIIFETMVFADGGTGQPVDHFTSRYTDKKSAAIGHTYTVRFLRRTLRRPPLINKGGKP